MEPLPVTDDELPSKRERWRCRTLSTSDRIYLSRSAFVASAPWVSELPSRARDRLLASPRLVLEPRKSVIRILVGLRDSPPRARRKGREMNFSKKGEVRVVCQGWMDPLVRGNIFQLAKDNRGIGQFCSLLRSGCRLVGSRFFSYYFLHRIFMFSLRGLIGLVSLLV